MLQNFSTFRLILIGFITSIFISTIFNAPIIIIEILTIGCIMVFWVRYFAMKNALSLWKTLAVAIIVFYFYFLIFSESLAWLTYFLLCAFWYIISDYFFPNVFVEMIDSKKNSDIPFRLGFLVYFFFIPGIAFF